MIIPVDIPDGSPELDELQFVVDGINAERKVDAQAGGHPVPQLMTEAEYLVPIVLAYFRKRVTDHYIGFARTKTPEQLADVLGPLNTIRGKKHGN